MTTWRDRIAGTWKLAVLACLAGACARPAAAPGSGAAPAIPRPEFPDPIFERETWQNLNGTWEFDFDPAAVGVQEKWFIPGHRAFSKNIVVPFPWESERSGLRAVGTRGAAWYRRTFRVAPAWANERVFLRFGAVDEVARVWVNGREAGTHEGGYTPFEFDITDFVRRDAENDLVVRAFDVIDKQTPTGKQTAWYTPTSGIWQTVWLEARPRVYLAGLTCTPDIRVGGVLCDVRVRNATAASETVDLDISGEGVGEVRRPCVLGPGQTASVPIGLLVSSPELWSPEHPRLYPIAVRVRSSAGEDVVKSYVALREVKIDKAPGRDYAYVYLNGKPIYLRGALDQSFNPKGIYTFPADADIRRDIEIAKECGLNFLRIHIKIDEPRLYYWADKLGMLIMQDLPSPASDTPRMRVNMETLYRDVLARDFNHPSIFAWVLFNETWGLTKHRTPEAQEWLAGFYKRAKSLDPTRLVEDNSPCNEDHVATDLNTWHFYINDYGEAKRHIQEVVDKTAPGSAFNYIGGRKQGTAPLMNSEYGGISAGMGDQDISWSFKFLTNELRKHPKICGYVYTELMDIEWEHNGFVNYDRTPKEFGYGDLTRGMTLKDLNDPDFVVIDAPPCATVGPEGTFECDLLVSHFSERDLSHARLYWGLSPAGPYGQDYDSKGELIESNVGIGTSYGSIDIQPAPYDVTKVHHLTIQIPWRGHSTLFCLIRDKHGRESGFNYINLYAPNSRGPRRRLISAPTDTDEIWRLRFRPVECAEYQWTAVSGNASSDGEKLCGYGTGYFEYRIRIPDEIPIDAIGGLGFMAEMSSKAADQKLAWPARRNPADYPQTDATKWPTDVTISMNGVDVGNAAIPDDPADARGILTHVVGHHPGSHGYVSGKAVFDSAVLTNVLKAVKERTICIRLEVRPEAKHRGGLAIFGERLGWAQRDPELEIRLKTPVKFDPSKANVPVALATARFGGAEGASEWLVVGPFRRGLDAVYPPEEKIDLAADVETLAGRAKWKPARAGTRQTAIPSPRGDLEIAELDFLPLFGPHADAVAYALVHANVPADTDAKLLLGSDGGVKAWLNGALVHRRNIQRRAPPDQDAAPVRLRAGWNRLLVKVARGRAGWSLAARLTTPDGAPIEGLKFDSYGDLPH